MTITRTTMADYPYIATHLRAVLQSGCVGQTLWTDDDGVKKAYDQRADFQLNDSAS